MINSITKDKAIDPIPHSSYLDYLKDSVLFEDFHNKKPKQNKS